MNINVWTNFTKRRNSTKQPTSGTTVTCVLKEETSIENPSFILNTPIANYTYVEAFGHYYFVDDVININAGMCELVCSMDVLASYKSDITSYTAFVERSASSYDVFVNDNLLSNQQKIINMEHSTASMTKIGGSCFVVQVLSGDPNPDEGGVVLYATPDLTPYAKLLQSGTYNAQDIIDWIDKKIAQAFDLDVYIGTVKWLPINPSQIGTVTNDFYVGPIEVGVPAGYSIYKSKQTPYYRDMVYGMTIPSTYAYGDFRDCNPRFSKYTLRLPGVGLVELDPVMMGSILHDTESQLNIDIEIDYISGDVVYYLQKAATVGTAYEEFARYRGNISVDIPIAKSTADFGKSVNTFAGSVGAGLAAGGAVGAAVGAVAGLVGVVANELTPDTSMIGGGGNRSDISYTSGALRLYVELYGSKDYPTAVAGRPLMQNVILSSLSGFVKCGNASVPVNAHAAERDAINSFLNSGFYIE